MIGLCKLKKKKEEEKFNDLDQSQERSKYLFNYNLFEDSIFNRKPKENYILRPHKIALKKLKRST